MQAMQLEPGFHHLSLSVVLNHLIANSGSQCSSLCWLSLGVFLGPPISVSNPKAVFEVSKFGNS